MKTTTDKKTKSELKNRPEPLSTTNPRQIDFVRRKANRSLDTQRLLVLLERETPSFFELAEVVGKWVWIQFAEKQPTAVTRVLAELGFHWNKGRQSWQHPCGLFRDRSSRVDPRAKYACHLAKTVKAAACS
jgi:hypothetical protein